MNEPPESRSRKADALALRQQDLDTRQSDLAKKEKDLNQLGQVNLHRYLPPWSYPTSQHPLGLPQRRCRNPLTPVIPALSLLTTPSR